MKSFNRKRSGAVRRAGLSLTEVVLASTMFTGIGFVLSMSMRASESSHRTVATSAALNGEMRATTKQLRDELKAARRETINVVGGGAFSTLEFQMAIVGAGPVPAWGAFERRLELDEADCHKAGWTVRYSADPAAGQNPPLLREIVDAAGAVRHTRTLAESVSRFTVTESGDVWVIELVAVGDEGTRQEEFDVRTRDQ